MPTMIEIGDIVDTAKPGDTLRKIFNPRLVFGPALLEHCFIEVGFPDNWKFEGGSNRVDLNKIEDALQMCQQIMNKIADDHKGYIIYKQDSALTQEGDSEKAVIVYTEFHPMLFNQHKTAKNLKYFEMESFDKAVDKYFSSIEGQKIDRKALQQEKDALKKLDNVKKDHEKRLQELARLQEVDKRKAYLIEANNDLVERALLVIRSFIANQFSWDDIKLLIKEAQEQFDPIACRIKGLKLETNHFTIQLDDPFDDDVKKISENIDIDIDLSAYGNARKYYDQKRHAAQKEQKTLDASNKALKNAELKTHQTLKEVAIKTSITKARKVLWFEKFMWFISSENFLVIGGKDAAQNEFIVKRHLKPGDIYVHADLHGASSVVIKNQSDNPIPPKTLEEASIMAVCYSYAWENKTSSRSWWVHSHQVSKTAPSGEYLTLGAFMIRGKKNYLPMATLVMGFGMLFRLDEESIDNHKDERRIKVVNDDSFNQDDGDNEVDLKDSDDENEGDIFPDTKVKNYVEKVQDEPEPVEITGSQIPRIKQQTFKKRGDKRSNVTAKIEQAKKDEEAKEKSKSNSNQLKRGQRYKLKKIKEKYKDQDEEERKIKMAILGSARLKNEQSNNTQKSCNEFKCDNKNDRQEYIDKINLRGDEENADKKEKNSDNENEKEDNNVDNNEISVQNKVESVKEPVDSGDDDEDEDNVRRADDDLKLLNSLTGQPTPEDNLLYAIPVVAPYSAISNYKYRVKVMPGSNKRGKGAKTALNLFLNDKSATQREKDLLKSCKDQDLARNLPNKIKMTAINLNAMKKSR